MQTKPLLPELIEDLGEKAQSPEWRWLPFSGLRTIADKLRIDDLQQQPRYNSIPDIWAQTWQFEAGLLATSKPSSPDVDAWRALLSIWAIADDAELDVKYRVLRLEVGSRQSFAAAAERLKPISVRVGGDNWNEIGILSSGGIPLAIANPATLLAPAVCATDCIRGLMPEWVKGDRICDPLKTGLLVEGQKNLVYQAMLHVEARLTALQDEHGSGTSQTFSTRLVKLIADFIKELRDAGARGSAEAGTSAQRGFSRDRLVSVLNTSFKTVHRNEPAFRLPARAEFRTAGIRGLAVADEALASTLGLPADRVMFWRGNSLARVTSEAAVFERVKEEAAREGYLVVKPGELFAPLLCEMRELLVAAHRGTARSFVLPVDPLILAFVEPSRLVSSLKIVPDGERYRAELTLRLSRLTGGETLDHTIVHVYDRKVVELGPTACGIWPDFRVPSWKSYFVFSRSIRGATVEPRSAFVLRSAAASIAGQADAASRVKILASLRQNLVNGATRKLASRPNAGVVEMVDALSGPPEAILCDADTSIRDIDGNRKSDEPVMKYAGLLIAPSQETCPDFSGPKFVDVVPKTDPSPWTVGIDFGTSNTSVYVAKPRSDPKPLMFGMRIVSPFSNGWDVARDFYRRDAIIGDPVSGIFQTILQGHIPLTGLPEEYAAWADDTLQAPVWSHKILYNTNLVRNLESVRDGAETTVFGRYMKWGLGLESTDADLLNTRVGMYLRQVCMQSLAECAADGTPPDRVDMRFSFPEAFGSATRDGYMQTCRNAVSDVTGGLRSKGLQVETRPLDEARFLENSESRCAAIYFAKEYQAFLNETVVVFDVGGGTTDMVIVRNNKVLWHGSLRMAGQEAFVAPLIKSGLLRRVLAAVPQLQVSRETYDEIAAKSGLEKEAVELIINSTEFSFDAGNMSLISSDPSEESRWLKGVVTFALGGLVYYAGRVLGQALGEEGRKNFPASETIHLCFGGRGARMFKNFVPMPIHASIVSLFGEAAGLPQAMFDDPIFTKDPKQEVAYGLVASREIQEKLDWREDDLLLPPLGERLYSRSRKVTKGGDGSYRDLDMGGAWRIDDDMPEFKSFLSAFARNTGVTANFSDALMAKIRNAANDGEDGLLTEMKSVTRELAELSKYGNVDGAPARTAVDRKVDAALRSRQPPFILLVRQAIRTLISEGPKSQKARVDVGS
ncbi:MAG TPA: hypothetical protein VGF56_11220 [Rhizomicrobium sp.]|jgi:hypothetical protein